MYGYNTKANEIAAKFHPNWHNLKPTVRQLHSRNVGQVLGQDLKIPSSFVLCWTKNGSGSGGTGQAVRIAHHYNVPVVNIRDGNGWNNLPKEHQWIYNQYLYNLRNYDKLKEMA